MGNLQQQFCNQAKKIVEKFAKALSPENAKKFMDLGQQFFEKVGALVKEGEQQLTKYADTLGLQF